VKATKAETTTETKPKKGSVGAAFSSPGTPQSVGDAGVKRSVREREAARAGGPVPRRGRPPKDKAPEISREPVRVTKADVDRMASLALMGNGALAALESQLAPIMSPAPTAGKLTVSEGEAQAWGGAAAACAVTLDPNGFIARTSPFIVFGLATCALVVPRVVFMIEAKARVRELEKVVNAWGGTGRSDTDSSLLGAGLPPGLQRDRSNGVAPP